MSLYDNKILTVSSKFDPPKGGIAQIVYNYSKYVFDTFYHVSNGKSERSLGSYALLLFHPWRMLWQFIKHPSIKIVHIHSCSYNSFKHATWTARFAKLCGKKVVVHMHGGGFKEYYIANKSFVQLQLRKVDAVIALSVSWKVFYTKEIGLGNVHVVPNIVPTSKKIIVEKDDGVFNLLYLGHICKSKGIFDLVELINENHEDYKGKLMLYVGGGMYEEENLRKYVKNNDLCDVVTLCGWVSGVDKIRLLSIADTFILPSYKEGQPVSIIEAMSYGLPILSTNIGGIPELVTEGGNGFLFEPGDKKQMKLYIDKLIVDIELRKKMGCESQKNSKIYTPHSVKQVLNDVYSAL